MILQYDQKLYGMMPHSWQDHHQVMMYDNKWRQANLWSSWMPKTWMFDELRHAMEFAENANGLFPLISKAKVGASSVNVRLIQDKEQLLKHIDQIWLHGGIPVDHCDSQGTRTRQDSYVILQEFIPHEITYRVNVIGNQNAIFLRRNHPDRPMAETGQTDPVYQLNHVYEDLLEYANSFAHAAGTKWVALDILWKPHVGWKLLETSLSWPWPSPGDCNNATFFPSGRKWIDMWDVLFDEWEAGAWGNVQSDRRA